MRAWGGVASDGDGVPLLPSGTEVHPPEVRLQPGGPRRPGPVQPSGPAAGRVPGGRVRPRPAGHLRGESAPCGRSLLSL